jgi:hypothetical protein
MPGSVLNSLVEQAGGIACNASSSMSSADIANNPVREDVRRDILRRMASMSQSGCIFEEGARYVDSTRDAEDARLIVQGIDPASVEATKRGDIFFESRDIQVERAHWVASMQGLFATAKYGCAYVHTDGSLTMLQQGRDTQCKCGSVHAGV